MRFTTLIIAMFFSCLSFISTAFSEIVVLDNSSLNNLKSINLSPIKEINATVITPQVVLLVTHRPQGEWLSITVRCLNCARVEQQHDYFRLRDRIRDVWETSWEQETPEHFQTAVAHHFKVGLAKWNHTQLEYAFRQYGNVGRLTVAVDVTKPSLESGHLDDLPEFPYEVLWLKDRGFTCAWLDSITLDGYCLEPLEVSGDTVYFNYITGSYEDEGLLLQPAFVSITKTCNDPRLSGWWLRYHLDNRTSLWEAVQIAALSHDLPEVTSEIVDHMIRCGVVTFEELNHMTSKRIIEVMRAYTALVVPAEELGQLQLLQQFPLFFWDSRDHRGNQLNSEWTSVNWTFK